MLAALVARVLAGTGTYDPVVLGLSVPLLPAAGEEVVAEGVGVGVLGLAGGDVVGGGDVGLVVELGAGELELPTVGSGVTVGEGAGVLQEDLDFVLDFFFLQGAAVDVGLLLLLP